MATKTFMIATDADLHADVCREYGFNVYFLWAAEVGRVKIGTSYRPAQRFAEIQAMSPVALTYLGCTPGGADVEARWHERFRHLRLHGEWFREDDDLMTEIAVADLTRKFKSLTPRAAAAFRSLIAEYGPAQIPDAVVEAKAEEFGLRRAGGNRVKVRGVDLEGWLR